MKKAQTWYPKPLAVANRIDFLKISIHSSFWRVIHHLHCLRYPQNYIFFLRSSVPLLKSYLDSRRISPGTYIHGENSVRMTDYEISVSQENSIHRTIVITITLRTWWIPALGDFNPFELLSRSNMFPEEFSTFMQCSHFVWTFHLYALTFPCSPLVWYWKLWLCRKRFTSFGPITVSTIAYWGEIAE